MSILKKKVNNWEKKIHDSTTIIHINQYQTDKQDIEKRLQILIKKIPGVSGLVTTIVLITKIGEVDNKILDVSGLFNKTDSHANISDIRKK